MLSLIQVECPHCGARGQIMVPPVGAIIIGPCPECSELVVVFCGHVLALDRETMENSSTDDRREHLLGVLTEFLQDRIARLLSDDVELLEGEPGEEVAEADNEYANRNPSFDGNHQPERSPISQREFERFTDVDLKLIDNPTYFKFVFEED